MLEASLRQRFVSTAVLVPLFGGLVHVANVIGGNRLSAETPLA
jgi:hypothetical protein